MAYAHCIPYAAVWVEARAPPDNDFRHVFSANRGNCHFREVTRHRQTPLLFTIIVVFRKQSESIRQTRKNPLHQEAFFLFLVYRSLGQIRRLTLSRARIFIWYFNLLNMLFLNARDNSSMFSGVSSQIQSILANFEFLLSDRLQISHCFSTT